MTLTRSTLIAVTESTLGGYAPAPTRLTLNLAGDISMNVQKAARTLRDAGFPEHTAIMLEHDGVFGCPEAAVRRARARDLYGNGTVWLAEGPGRLMTHASTREIQAVPEIRRGQVIVTATSLRLMGITLHGIRALSVAVPLSRVGLA